MPDCGPVCDSVKAPPAQMHAYTPAHNLTISSHMHALTNTQTHTTTQQIHIVFSTLAHREGQVSVVSDVQQPTPDDTQFAKRTSKNRRVKCQTQDEKCSATDKQRDGW